MGEHIDNETTRNNIFDVFEPQVVDRSVLSIEYKEYTTPTRDTRLTNRYRIKVDDDTKLVDLANSYIRFNARPVNGRKAGEYKDIAKPVKTSIIFERRGDIPFQYYSRFKPAIMANNAVNFFRNISLKIAGTELQSIQDPGEIYSIWDMVHASKTITEQTGSTKCFIPDRLESCHLSNPSEHIRRETDLKMSSTNAYNFSFMPVDMSSNPAFVERGNIIFNTYTLRLLDLFPILRSFDKLIRASEIILTFHKGDKNRALIRDSVDTTTNLINDDDEPVDVDAFRFLDGFQAHRQITDTFMYNFINNSGSSDTERCSPTIQQNEQPDGTIQRTIVANRNDQLLSEDNFEINDFTLHLAEYSGDADSTAFINRQLQSGSSIDHLWGKLSLETSPIFKQTDNKCRIVVNTISEPIRVIYIACYSQSNLQNIERYKDTPVTNFITQITVKVGNQKFPRDDFKMKFPYPLSPEANYVEAYQYLLSTRKMINPFAPDDPVISAAEFGLYRPFFLYTD